MTQPRPVIFDIGLHHGDDTDFYLRKGFDVVAVEADPRHVETCRTRFARELAEGRLEIIDAAIADNRGELTFYRNLDKDDWSSTDPKYGQRDGTRFETITVPTVTFAEIYERITQGSGIAGRGPRRVHYVKCDIEGADRYVLADLLRVSKPHLPTHFSVEAHHGDYFAFLRAAGYTRFKLVNQNLNWMQKLPSPPLEGEYVEYVFKGDTSGPFGEEAPGRWISFDECLEIYFASRRISQTYPSITLAWYDVHARLGE